MNWNKCIRITLQFILVIILFIVTFIQFLKYEKENTNVSISYEEKELKLPSMTICPRNHGNNKKQGNITFEEYMKGVPNISQVFDFAEQLTYLPGKR